MSLSIKKISGAVAPAFVSLALIFATSGVLLVTGGDDAFAVQSERDGSNAFPGDGQSSGVLNAHRRGGRSSCDQTPEPGTSICTAPGARNSGVREGNFTVITDPTPNIRNNGDYVVIVCNSVTNASGNRTTVCTEHRR